MGYSQWGRKELDTTEGLTQKLGTWASVVEAHGLSCPAACGIFPNQGLNPCPLHLQADS